jgi:Na+-transporting NADH:ubiquinone oxidoreductase subunit C
MVTASLVTGIAYLGFQFTEPIIIENRNKKIAENIALLYSPDDGFTKNDDQSDNTYSEKNRKYTDNSSGNISGIYEVLDNDGELVAIIYNVNAQGRNGIVNALIAVDPYENTIVGVTYYEHGETPNLGERYTREEEYIKLINQTIDNVVVDQISGATTTWNAINDMFNIISIHFEDEEVHIDG